MKALFVFSLVILLCAGTDGLAHSGRTDSSGGHYNHKNDSYHYHTGHPATFFECLYGLGMVCGIVLTILDDISEYKSNKQSKLKNFGTKKT